MATIELERAPSKMSLYYRAVTSKKPGKLQGDTLPAINANLKQVKADLGKLKQYRKVCGFPVSGSMPATFPHIMAFPLHLEIMVNPLFPFPLLGLVHVRNQITQYRAIGNQEILDIECEVVGPETVAKGLQFDFVTKVSVAGNLVWEGLSTYLFRTKTNVEENKADKKADDFSADSLNYWEVPEDIGRRYAKVSGDSNLIHLHAITAKFFGFPKAIAHGMWSKARAIGELESQLPPCPFKVDVAFKLPIFLPNKVQFQSQRSGDAIAFRLKDKNGEKPHLAGSIERL